MSELPPDVVEWVRSVFAACNERVSEKLTMNPNGPEESLDLTWVEQLTHFSSPVALESEWIVKIESHYLGGLRHFRSWEIADIGVLVFLRLGAGATKTKVALLQSKRLYPDGVPVRHETRTDYEIGIARLADPEDQTLSISFETDYRFTEQSRYSALQRGSDQARAIDKYQEEVGFKVYYHFYNPWSVPFVQRIPLAGYVPPAGSLALGVRMIPATVVHTILSEQNDRSPALRDLRDVSPRPAYGWRLEQFICDELLGCREGNEFTHLADDRIQSLFYRRSGPIAAAIAITIEAPSAAG